MIIALHRQVTVCNHRKLIVDKETAELIVVVTGAIFKYPYGIRADRVDLAHHFIKTPRVNLPAVIIFRILRPRQIVTGLYHMIARIIVDAEIIAVNPRLKPAQVLHRLHKTPAQECSCWNILKSLPADPYALLLYGVHRIHGCKSPHMESNPDLRIRKAHSFPHSVDLFIGPYMASRHNAQYPVNRKKTGLPRGPSLTRITHEGLDVRFIYRYIIRHQVAQIPHDQSDIPKEIFRIGRIFESPFPRKPHGDGEMQKSQAGTNSLFLHVQDFFAVMLQHIRTKDPFLRFDAGPLNAESVSLKTHGSHDVNIFLPPHIVVTGPCKGRTVKQFSRFFPFPPVMSDVPAFNLGGRSGCSKQKMLRKSVVFHRVMSVLSYILSAA